MGALNKYCDVALGHPLHGPHHDDEYGFPLTDEAELLERLSLEIFQAGLSWVLILRKRPGINAAFDGFDVDTVAAYDGPDRERLLGDSNIIRNKLKVDAIIGNARSFQKMRDSHGGMAGWLAAHHPRKKDDWVKLFRQTFKFVGPESVNEFLMSIGYLPGAHREDCPVYGRIAALDPPWMRAQ